MAFKMRGAPFQVHKPGHKGKPGEKVVAQGADENDVKADAEYDRKRQPGYEPPVKRSELDAKGKAIYDSHRATPETNYDPRIETEKEVVIANLLEDLNNARTPGEEAKIRAAIKKAKTNK
jgi:hypothetical protein